MFSVAPLVRFALLLLQLIVAVCRMPVNMLCDDIGNPSSPPSASSKTSGKQKKGRETSGSSAKTSKSKSAAAKSAAKRVTQVVQYATCCVCAITDDAVTETYRGKDIHPQCNHDVRSRGRLFATNPAAAEQDRANFYQRPDVWRADVKRFRDDVHGSSEDIGKASRRKVALEKERKRLRVFEDRSKTNRKKRHWVTRRKFKQLWREDESIDSETLNATFDKRYKDSHRTDQEGREVAWIHGHEEDLTDETELRRKEITPADGHADDSDVESVARYALFYRFSRSQAKESRTQPLPVANLA